MSSLVSALPPVKNLGTYSRRVTELVLLAGENLSQDATHNLATSSLRQIRNDKDSLGGSEGTDALSDLEDEILSQLIIDLIAILDCNEGIDSLSGEFIVDTDDSGFSNGVMLDQSSFNFGSRETMTADVDDIVDSSSDPVIAFVVPSCSVARELQDISE